jgi:hypothetical protein
MTTINLSTLKTLTDSPEQYRTIIINTAHLSATGKAALDQRSVDGECDMVFKRDTGWLVKLFDDPECNQYQNNDLNALLALVLAGGYHMIDFDGDGAFYPCLALFE